ncbi:MAG: phosphotransferase family protein [Longimicrobiales bacterium]
MTELLRACRPELEIRSLEYLAGGDFCHAYVLNRHQVVRIPKHEEAAGALAREACLLAEIAHRLPVAVPLPTYVRCAASMHASFAVHERIHGRELTRDLWQGLPEAARTHLARALGGFLQALHALNVGVGHACGLPLVDHRAQVERLQQRMRAEPGSLLPESMRTALADCLGRSLAGGVAWRYEPALLHADVGPGHVLVDVEQGDITGVIDWGDAAIGDPARDFIFLYEDWGSDFLDSALDGYGLETKQALLPRVLVRYLADQLEWTLKAGEERRAYDLEHGVAALRQAVRDFEASAA